MLFDELDVAHRWHVEIIIISNCFDTWEKLYPSYIYQSERRWNGSRIVENTNCINAIVFNYVYYIVFVIVTSQDG